MAPAAAEVQRMTQATSTGRPVPMAAAAVVPAVAAAAAETAGVVEAATNPRPQDHNIIERQSKGRFPPLLSCPKHR